MINRYVIAIMLLSLSGLCHAGKPELWGFLDRESNGPCSPLQEILGEYKSPMTIEEVMAIFSPSGFTASTYPPRPMPERGMPITVPAFYPNNGGAPLMTKESCQQLEAALIRYAGFKPSIAVPEQNWYRGLRQR
jgi:hypothetical protein